jgi:hypothetical protein
MDGVKLTDEQVARLVNGEDAVTVDNEDFIVEALAVEVQQARQRRCENCAHATPNPPQYVTAPWEALECRQHETRMGDCWTVAVDYFCADFVQKPDSTS